ncbi:MAG: hypothetical protein K2I29_00740, partial [Clostridia bacterium]|nr:hypothetical protein [Clostridia bacterium]
YVDLFTFITTVFIISGYLSVDSGLYDGGGVYVTRGTFEMNGGTISGNTTHRGGGVCVDDNGTFTMNGGQITGNTTPQHGEAAGVYVY